MPTRYKHESCMCVVRIAWKKFTELLCKILERNIFPSLSMG